MMLQKNYKNVIVLQTQLLNRSTIAPSITVPTVDTSEEESDSTRLSTFQRGAVITTIALIVGSFSWLMLRKHRHFTK
jgi:hypothetical protein